MPTVKTVTFEELRREIPKVVEKTTEELRYAVVKGLERSLPGIVERSPVDTGEYANSWMLTYDEKMALIGNYAPHAPIIEDGARPFSPPITPLLAWAKRVLKDPSQPPDYSKEVRSLAWGVKRKIEKEGMRPRHVMANSLDLMIENIRREVIAL